MYQELERIHQRPGSFARYTAADLWTDRHISAHMLRLHLDQSHDIASRKTAFIDRSVEWIASRFEISSATRIADFGCGPGLYTSRLALEGAHVTGIDFSPRSIRHATEQAERLDLSIRHVCGDYLQYDTDDRFDLILMISCDFCALGPAQRRDLLGRFFTFLKPGGHVLLDAYSITTFDQRREAASIELNPLGGFWSPHRHYEFLNTFKYEQEKVVLDQYTVVEADRLRTIYNWLQCFDPDEIQREFAVSGLSGTELYADVAGSELDPEAAEFAVVAAKP